VAEISFKSVGLSVDSDFLKNNSILELAPLGIITPIRVGTGRSDLFEMHFDPVSQISDNLRNLILTNHGERIGRFNYGANLRPLLTELGAKEDWDAQAMRKIIMAVKTWLPAVELDTFNSELHEVATTNNSKGVATIKMTIKYSIPQFRKMDLGIEVTMLVAG